MLVKLFLITISLVLAASAPALEWENFKATFNKQYTTREEELMRQKIFFTNLEKLQEHKRINADASYDVGINYLMDHTIEELVSKSKFAIKSVPLEKTIETPLKDLPDSFDWRTKGVITPVEDEGILGQDTAFVSVEVIETLHAIQTKQLVSGSIARVIDCCPTPVDPFNCIAKLGGICSAADYPKPTGQCLPNQCHPYASFKKILRLKNKDENMMAAWIQNSTLYAGIDASHVSFQAYVGGVYSDNSCSAVMIDHVMQIVGYGKTETGLPYWICRNTWGTSWGEQGYIRVLRGKNMCGIASYVAQVA